MIRTLSYFLAVCFLLSSLTSAADQLKPTDSFLSVEKALLNGKPLVALNLAEECASSNSTCAQYLFVQYWFLDGDEDTASRLIKLREKHQKSIERKIRNKVPQATALDIWERANHLSYYDDRFGATLGELEPVLESNGAFVWYVAGYLRSYVHNEFKRRDGLPYFIKASQLGAPHAMVKAAEALACRMCPGEPDDLAAKAWLDQAAILGHAPALTKMGYWYRRGLFFKKDVRLAESMLNQAVELGDPNAQCELGKMALHGDGMAVDRYSAERFFIDGLAAGGETCSLYYAEALEQMWIISTNNDTEEEVFKQCALLGSVTCLISYARILLGDTEIPSSEHLGVKLLAPIVSANRKAAGTLANYYGYLNEDGAARKAYELYLSSIENKFDYGYYKLIPLMVDKRDQFTDAEHSFFPNYLEHALENNYKGLTFTLAMFYAKGLYVERDPEEASKWAWAAIVRGSDRDRRRVLEAFESDAYFIDDERLKWAIRNLIGEKTDEQSKVGFYKERLLTGSAKQKDVAFREIQVYLGSESLDHTVKTGLAIAFSDPTSSRFDKEKFKALAQAMLHQSGSFLPDDFYEVGRRAHLSSNEIRDNVLALSLFELGNRRALGLKIRLLANPTYELHNPSAAIKNFETLIVYPQKYNGKFYSELARYAYQNRYSIGRPDIADAMFRQSLLKGYEPALMSMVYLTEELKAHYGDDFKRMQLVHLEPSENYAEVQLARLIAATRLESEFITETEVLEKAVGVYRDIARNSKHDFMKAWANYRLARLQGLDQEVVKNEPLRQRAQFARCLESTICPKDAKSAYALNLIQFEPKNLSMAQDLMNDHIPGDSNDQRYTLKYFSETNNSQGWNRALKAMKDKHVNGSVLIYYMADTIFEDASSETVWSLLLSFDEPIEPWAEENFIELITQIKAFPRTPEAIEKIKMLIQNLSIDEYTQAALFGELS